MEESERIKQTVTGTASAIQKEIAGTGGEQPTEGRADRALVERIIEHWAAVPQKVARRMIEKYGPPNEAIPSRLIWYQNGPGSARSSIAMRSRITSRSHILMCWSSTSTTVSHPRNSMSLPALMEVWLRIAPRAR